MSQPVWQKKARVSLFCSSEEFWELFALSASASGLLYSLYFWLAQICCFWMCTQTHIHKIIFLASQEMYASVFYVVPCKEYSGFWCYGCSLFVLIVSEKHWIGVKLVCVCSSIVSESVLLNQ